MMFSDNLDLAQGFESLRINLQALEYSSRLTLVENDI